jgi:hypothetical protein
MADQTGQVQFLPPIKPFITLNILVTITELMNVGYALIKQVL